MTKADELYNMHLEMAPVRVELELTEACNLRCLFCYNSLKPRISRCAFQVLDILARENVMELILTGGEPALHPEFPAIVERAVTLFPSVMVQSNGTLLNRELILKLAALGVFGINVSLHGVPAIHDQLTGVSGSHEKALRAIHHVLSAEPALELWVNTVLTSRNLNILYKHFQICFDSGVRIFTLTRYTPAGAGRTHSELALSGTELINALRSVRRFQEDHPGTQFVMANAVPRCALPEDLADMAHGCGYGTCRFYVDVEGNLINCGMLRESLGSLLQHGIRELKSGSQVFRSIASGCAMPAECQKCRHFLSCHGGCRAASALTTGKLDGPDPYCVFNVNRSIYGTAL